MSVCIRWIPFRRRANHPEIFGHGTVRLFRVTEALEQFVQQEVQYWINRLAHQCQRDLFILSGSAQKFDVQTPAAKEHLVQSRFDIFEFQRAVMFALNMVPRPSAASTP